MYHKQKEAQHILRDNRYVIEQMLRSKQPRAAIANTIGCTRKTLEREIARGIWQRLVGESYEYVTEYAWDVKQRRHEESGRNKGRYAKLNDAPELRSFLEEWIKKRKYSPQAALFKAREYGFAIPIIRISH